jgi:hypothetical protein
VGIARPPPLGRPALLSPPTHRIGSASPTAPASPPATAPGAPCCCRRRRSCGRGACRTARKFCMQPTSRSSVRCWSSPLAAPCSNRAPGPAL